MGKSETRWIVRCKSRVITGAWEERLFSQEDNARGFARDAGEGVTVRAYAPIPAVTTPRERATKIVETWSARFMGEVPNGATYANLIDAITAEI